MEEKALKICVYDEVKVKDGGVARHEPAPAVFLPYPTPSPITVNSTLVWAPARSRAPSFVLSTFNPKTPTR